MHADFIQVDSSMGQNVCPCILFLTALIPVQIQGARKINLLTFKQCVVRGRLLITDKNTFRQIKLT